MNRYLELTKTSKVKYLKSNNKMYTSMVSNKRTMYSFIHHRSADTCVQFLTNYKILYGNYPDTKTQDYTSITVHEETIGSLQNLCALLNIGLLCITEFNYTFNKGSCDVQFEAADLITQDIQELADSKEFDYVKYIYISNLLKKL